MIFALSSCDTCRHSTVYAEIEEYTPSDCRNGGYYYSVTVCRECNERIAREKVELDIMEHTVDGHICTACGEVVVSSSGLSLSLNEEKTGYVVTSILGCETDEVYIGYHEGLPILAVSHFIPSLNEPDFTTQKLHFGSTVREINLPEMRGFLDEIAEISVSPGNECFASLDGVLYSANMDTLLYYPRMMTREEFTLPDSVKTIGESAFYFSMVKKIDLPLGLLSISKNCFLGSYELSEIYLPDGVTDISEGAFSGCSNLESVRLSPNTTHIGYEAFKGCRALTELFIPKSVTDIDGRVFIMTTDVTLFCEVEGKPDGWVGDGTSANDWCRHVKEIKWGCTPNTNE